MAIFGKKKETKIDKKTLDELEVPAEIQAKMLAEAANKESKFTTPEDLMKMTAEQVNPEYSKPSFVDVQSMQPIQPVMQLQQMNVQKPQQGFAPLFVKIDRYRNILKSLGELKTTLVLMKNAFIMLDQMEQLKTENMNLIMNALDKIEKKLAALDSEFLRPSGFQDEMSDAYEVENKQGVISDLHSQIQQLQNEVQQVQ